MSILATYLAKQLKNRDFRAITEYMLVLSEDGPYADVPSLYTVVSKSGHRYTVDLEIGTCECNDAFHDRPEGGCAHLRRVEFATKRRPIPGWVADIMIDEQLQLDLQSK